MASVDKPGFNLFGWSFRRSPDADEQKRESFVEPESDGSLSVAVGAVQSTFVDLEGAAKTEAELVTRYRGMLQQAEVYDAVNDIVNEAIIVSSDKRVVEINLDDVELAESVKKKVKDEFEHVLTLLDFSNTGHDVFMKWYVDGRLYYHALIDSANPKRGLVELRYVDPRRIRKVRETEQRRDPGTGASTQRVKDEYFVYSERGFDNSNPTTASQSVMGLKIAKDSIVYCNSGLLNERSTVVLSHLNKAFKPLNQLRMMEDASVIYRMSRAPERRIFYIDVGTLPKVKAEQYLREMMTNHKNKPVYDADTGQMRDERKFATMTEDFWLPRREGNRGTEITSLPGGQNLGQMEDIEYFQKKLYKSLNVPVSRLQSDAAFSFGRSGEVSRDEVRFSKFVSRLRARFSVLFDNVLEKQLILKGVIRPEEWSAIVNKVRYDFMEDNHYEEVKDAELLRDKLSLLDATAPYVGTFFSREYVRKKVLHMTDEEVEEVDEQIAKEAKESPPVGEETPSINNSQTAAKSPQRSQAQ